LAFFPLGFALSDVLGRTLLWLRIGHAFYVESAFATGAHACSEIGLKWFLFAIYDLRAVLEFISVLDFFGHLSLSNPAETCKREF